MSLRTPLCVWLALLLPCIVLADSPVTISPEDCFVGMAPRGGVYPIAVALHNSGPSADGALIVKSESYSAVLRTYAYPVSLPTGTDKEIVVYPALGGDTSQVDLSFDGTARAKDVSLPLLDREGMQIGMIGDEPGALSSLRLTEAGQGASGGPTGPQSPHYNDCYARPEDAPDRAAGYQSMSVLVLGADSERLRPEQWAAIRHWVLDGGSLILTGGPGASYLRVPDAAPLLPLTGLRDVTLPSLTLPAKVLRPALPGGPVAVVSGTLTPGGAAIARAGGQVVLSRQALGAGTVLLVGFDPLEQPFRDWAGQHALWLALIRQASASLPAWNLRQWTAQQASFTEVNNGPFTAGGTAPGGYVMPAGQVDPFRVTLPPIKTIAWVFLAYFILVIPVTYVVLKRLGRLEWAWVTSPVLSIAFAYLFYLFTAQLYQAGMSRRTAGVVTAAAGDPDAQFDGFSEMFFPRGGSYALGIPGAEAMELSPFSGGDPGDGYYSSSGEAAQLQPLQTVDNGAVSVPDFHLGNLAFRRLYHTEPVSLGGAITASLTRATDGTLKGTVRDGTAQTLTGCFVYAPQNGQFVTVGDLAPGESKAVGRPGSVGPDAFQVSPFIFSTARHGSSTVAGAFLIARTSGAGFGPTALGRDVGGPQSVTLLVSLPVTAGEQP